MDEPLQPDTVICSCPSCGKKYRLARGHVGKTARCKECLQAFTVVEAPPEAPGETPQVAQPPGVEAPQAPAPLPPPPSGDYVLCTVCQQPIGPDEATKDCSVCQAPYHQECWEYNQGCGMYGCGEAPETEPLKSVEIPVSYWGKEEKNCPSCGNEIHAAALRCRNCGATFSSAKPQDRRTYREGRSKQERLPKVSRTGIVMLVFSVLSCTAPFVAIFGSIWYVSNRKDVQALPGMQSAMCRIALGLAYLQTLAIIVVYVISSSY